MKLVKGRVKLFEEVHLLAREIGYYQRGLFPTHDERMKTERHWVRLFGFRELPEMTSEDLTNFVGLLRAQIRVEKRNNCFPEFHNFIGCGTKREDESIYD